jgi:hypothetical protein
MSLVDANANKVVPSITKFRNQVDGVMVESAPAEAAIPAETTKYYLCTHPAASFHRKDGKRISFVYGYFVADLKPDQEYLDAEIADGNMYVSLANEDQIKMIKMKINPKKAIEEELRPQIESELREKLKAELLAEMQATGVNSIQKPATQGAGLTITPLTGLQVPNLTPVSTSDISKAASGSGGNQ